MDATIIDDSLTVDVKLGAIAGGELECALIDDGEPLIAMRLKRVVESGRIKSIDVPWA